MNLAKQLVDTFVERGYKWNIGGTLRPPSYQDMEQALKRIDETLNDNEQMEFGRLIAVKKDGHLDIYIYEGDYYGLEVH